MFQDTSKRSKFKKHRKNEQRKIDTWLNKFFKVWKYTLEVERTNGGLSRKKRKKQYILMKQIYTYPSQVSKLQK